MHATLTILPGDGIGPEVTAAAVAVLDAVADQYGHSFEKHTHLLGGIAIDQTGTALPEATLASCRATDAILMGAVGGPQWDDPDAAVRPEQGILGLRKALELFANLRPVRPHPALSAASPLKPEKLVGVDLLVIRELTGDVYFGERRCWVENGEERAYNTMFYTAGEIRRVVDLAFKAARGRRGKVTSIDKANVLDVMRLWRKTVNQVAEDYPDVAYEHVLVDAATMHLLSRPASFDVMVASNMFGDIITDEASMLAGSMGVLPSASLGDGLNRHGHPRGLYEPIHGSAPDIAGRGIANPIGTILSAAMLLRHSLGLEAEARTIERAVDAALEAGYRTADLAPGQPGTLNTQQMTEAIIGLCAS